MKKNILLITAFLFTSSYALTLDRAMEDAIAENMQIAEYQKRYEEIYYDTEMARAGYLPKINLSVLSGLNDSRANNVGYGKYNHELMLTQNIFNGFKDVKKRDLELSKYGSALYSTKELTNSFSLEVINAYLNLINQKRILDIQKSSMENNENIFKKITFKYNGGLGTQLEYRLSRTSLNLAKINYHEQIHILEQAKITLEKYLNRPIELVTVEYPYKDIAIPSTQEEALLTALESHPSIFVSRLNKKMTDYELSYTQSNMYPSLDFNANYYGGENGKYQNINEYYELYLKLSYNIYNGSSDYNSNKKIEQKIAQKQLLMEKVKRDIEEKIKSKYDEYILLKEKTVLLDEYVDSKEKTLESYYSQFSIGKANLRDILDTTESLYSAKKMQTTSNIELIKSKYKILEAMGQLPVIKYTENDLVDSSLKNINLDLELDKANKELNIEKLKIADDSLNKNAIKIEKAEQINVADKVSKISDNESVNAIEENRKASKYIVNATILRARESRDTKSKILGYYGNGDVVTSIDVTDFWIKTDIGWISKTYLKKISEGDK